VANLFVKSEPDIDYARLSREAMFVALPRKVDTMLPRAAVFILPRANLAYVESNFSGFLSCGKEISVCCGLSFETVLWRSAFSRELRNSVDQQPHLAAARRCWTATRLSTHKQTKDFASRNQYPA
jgi:hypothetical protein